jgi:hypothetical protein
MQLAFLTTFEMYSDADVDVWVTPIGMYEGSGQYGPLPRYRDSFPPAWPAKAEDVYLPAGSSVRFTYNWDDVNFRHILVRDRTGQVFIVDTDKRGDLHGCCSPEHDRYRIPPLDAMRKAPPELIPCTRGEVVRWKVIEYK